MKVAASVEEGHLRVDVGDNMVRIFALDALPDCLRLQLAMVHAWDWTPLVDITKDWHRSTFHGDNFFKCPIWYPEECRDIGWMMSDTEYVLVLSEEVIEELRGGTSHG
jgi:hypothetical protein